MDVERLAFVVRHFRLAQDMSIADLSRKTGVSISYISNLERAKHPRPGVERVQAIASGLGFGSYQEMLSANPAEVDRTRAPLPDAIAASVAPGVDRSKVSDESWTELRRVMREVIEEILEERGVIESRESRNPPGRE